MKNKKISLWITGFLMLVACAKDPESMYSDGPEISLIERHQIQSKNLYYDPKTIKEGDYSLYEFTQRLYLGAPAVVAYSSEEVLSAVQDKDVVITRSKIRQIFPTASGDDVEDQTLLERMMRVTGPASMNNIANPSLSRPLGFLFQKWPQVYISDYLFNDIEDYFACSLSVLESSTSEPYQPAPPGYRTTFHKLSVQNLKIPAPAAVQSQPKCSGLKDCKLDIVRMEYDEALRSQVGNGVKWTHCAFDFSANTPPLVRVLRLCRDFVVSYEGRQVPVQSCQAVQNFRFGQ